MPESLPQLPQGWVPLYDHSQSRWYYAEPATARTQWERPQDQGYGGPPPGGDGSRGFGGGYDQQQQQYGGQPQYGAPAPGYGGYPQQQQQYGGYPPQQQYGAYPQQQYTDPQADKNKDRKNMMLGAAGGLAAGAIGGALLANALGGEFLPSPLPLHRATLPFSFP